MCGMIAPQASFMAKQPPPGYLPPLALLAAENKLPNALVVSQHLLAADGSAVQLASADSSKKAVFEEGARSMAWAQGPALGQMAFLMWMIGSQLSLWSIYFLSTMGLAPIKAILNMQQGEPPFLLQQQRQQQWR